MKFIALFFFSIYNENKIIHKTWKTKTKTKKGRRGEGFSTTSRPPLSCSPSPQPSIDLRNALEGRPPGALFGLEPITDVHEVLEDLVHREPLYVHLTQQLLQLLLWDLHLHLCRSWGGGRRRRRREAWVFFKKRVFLPFHGLVGGDFVMGVAGKVGGRSQRAPVLAGPLHGRFVSETVAHFLLLLFVLSVFDLEKWKERSFGDGGGGGYMYII